MARLHPLLREVFRDPGEGWKGWASLGEFRSQTAASEGDMSEMPEFFKRRLQRRASTPNISGRRASLSPEQSPGGTGLKSHGAIMSSSEESDPLNYVGRSCAPESSVVLDQNGKMGTTGTGNRGRPVATEGRRGSLQLGSRPVAKSWTSKHAIMRLKSSFNCDASQSSCNSEVREPPQSLHPSDSEV